MGSEGEVQRGTGSSFHHWGAITRSRYTYPKSAGPIFSWPLVSVEAVSKLLGP
uniref:Uncharacterized protein n=1 Tax=Anguilla anguilla TaxID=7936 RepID=A0A0E9R7E1_ANGAN